jgi:hypothetical protein
MTHKPHTDRKQGLLWALALMVGFALSFAGFGVLWTGTPWHYQCLMFFPFLFLSFAVTRFSSNGAWFIWVGAMPIGLLLLQFRDKNDSHLASYLVVGTWIIGTLTGRYLGCRSGMSPSGSA